jgi:hypothetical protein
VGVGWGGALGTIFPDGTAAAGLKNPNRIAVYALDAKGVLAPPEPQQRTFDPPPATASMEQVSSGLLLFSEHCGVQAIQDFLIWKANQRKQAMSAPPAQ